MRASEALSTPLVAALGAALCNGGVSMEVVATMRCPLAIPRLATNGVPGCDVSTPAAAAVDASVWPLRPAAAA